MLRDSIKKPPEQFLDCGQSLSFPPRQHEKLRLVEQGQSQSVGCIHIFGGIVIRRRKARPDRLIQELEGTVIILIDGVGVGQPVERQRSLVRHDCGRESGFACGACHRMLAIRSGLARTLVMFVERRCHAQS